MQREAYVRHQAAESQHRDKNLKNQRKVTHRVQRKKLWLIADFLIGNIIETRG